MLPTFITLHSIMSFDNTPASDDAPVLNSTSVPTGTTAFDDAIASTIVVEPVDENEFAKWVRKITHHNVSSHNDVYDAARQLLALFLAATTPIAVTIGTNPNQTKHNVIVNGHRHQLFCSNDEKNGINNPNKFINGNNIVVVCVKGLESKFSFKKKGIDTFTPVLTLVSRIHHIDVVLKNVQKSEPIVVDNMKVYEVTCERNGEKRTGTIKIPVTLNVLGRSLDDMVELCMKSSSDMHVEAQFQTDTHGTKMPGQNGIYIGLTLVLKGKILPISLVGRDMGCGISICPLSLDVDPKHVLMVLQKLRNRRKVVAKRYGDENAMALKFIKLGYEHIGEDPIAELVNIYNLFVEEGTFTPRNGMTDDMKIAEFIKIFGSNILTIGATGNHFAEKLYQLLVHSGSRGVGALLYDWLVKMCIVVNANGLVAVESNQVDIVARVCDAMNRFAAANRAAMYYYLIDNLNQITNSEGEKVYNLQTSVEEVHAAYRNIKWVQEGCADTGIPIDVIIKTLIRGNTHNGIAIYKDGNNRVCMLLTKGSVVTNDFAIVAGRVGEGCSAAFSKLYNPNIVQITLAELSAMENPIFCSPEEFQLVQLPHGNGRNRSAAETSAMTETFDLLKYIVEKKFFMSFGPGTSQDCPVDGVRNAYRESYLDTYNHIAKIISIAPEKGKQAICVNYKEATDVGKNTTFAMNVESAYRKFFGPPLEIAFASNSTPDFSDYPELLEKYEKALISLDIGHIEYAIFKDGNKFLKWLFEQKMAVHRKYGGEECAWSLPTAGGR